MLATLGGTLALVFGLVILLVPLLLPELSRPRDAFWGAIVLLLGLVLVTTAERLSGAPMLAVLSGGLLIGRLGTEVGLGRWHQLSGEEQLRLRGAERWQTSAGQLRDAVLKLVGTVGASLGGLSAWIQERRQARVELKAKAGTKRWVRPEAAAAPESEPGPVVTVGSFEEIDELLQEALAAEAAEPAGNREEAGEAAEPDPPEDPAPADASDSGPPG
jgi:hypothetical protein